MMILIRFIPPWGLDYLVSSKENFCQGIEMTFNKFFQIKNHQDLKQRKTFHFQYF